MILLFNKIIKTKNKKYIKYSFNMTKAKNTKIKKNHQLNIKQIQ